jgi:hypothetical protein
MGSKARPVRKANNLTAICEQTVKKKTGIVDVSQLYRPPRPVTGIPSLFLNVGFALK